MLKLLDYQKDHAESIERALLSPNRVALDATFDTVTRAVAAVENETLYINEEGFAGYGIKRGGEAIDKCSTMSDILIIDNQGVLSVRRVQEKFYVGKKLLHISVLRPTDDWVFNMIYRDGKEGITYAKRFKLGGFTSTPVLRRTVLRPTFHVACHTPSLLTIPAMT